MLRRTRTQGQAIVEFALAATLIFFLLAAVVDVGLIFFAVQGLHNAAQEGASYGSRWLTYDAMGRLVPDQATIKTRVRFESGNTGGIGFVNLLDLNADGVNDSTQPGVVDANISVEMLADPSMDGDPTQVVSTGQPENVACPDASVVTTELCYVRVTVRSVHKMIFAFAPVFGKQVPLRSSYIVPVRDSRARGSTGGQFEPNKTCTMPDFKNVHPNSATAKWIGAGFTGTLTIATGSYTKIGTQSPAAGTVMLCTASAAVGP